MLRNTFFGLALAGLAFTAQPAGAFNLDFVALSAGNEHAFASELFANVDGSGIGVTAMARHLADDTPPFDDVPPYGYLDDLSGGKDGGLGVCPSDDCEGSPEDNISIREVAILEFDTVVEITSISFSNGEHNDTYSGSIGINIGASDPTTAEAFSNIVDTSSLVGGVLSGISLIGSRFQFVAPESFLNASTGENWKIYVSAITFDEFTNVPEPTSALLAGLGLVGLLAAGRRVKRD